MNSALLVARVSGLPASAVDLFLSEPCWQALGERGQLEDRLVELRADAVDRLYKGLNGASPDSRRFLLELKRACFNGRPISRLAARPEWREATSLLGSKAEELLTHERALVEADTALSKLYDSETARGRASLRPFLQDRRLLRGLSLASPDLIEELERGQEDGSDLRGRKRPKAERSLLRYLTRAAHKVSPYSTLCGVGTATLSDAPANGLPGLFGPPWEERSLVRARRFLIDQCFIFLARRASIRRRLRIALNSTIERLGDDVFRFLRPMDLVYEESEAKLKLLLPSQVKVRLSGPIIDHLLVRSWESLPLLGELIDELVTQCSSLPTEAKMSEDGPSHPNGGAAGESDYTDSVVDTLDQLLRLGFLEIRTPWSAYEARIEEPLVAYLRSLEVEEVLRPVAEALSRLVAGEDSFATASRPRAALADIHEALNDAWRHLAEANDLRLEPKIPFAVKPSVYEDVFLRSKGAGGLGEVVQLSAETARDLLRSGNSIARIFNVYSPRYNFLYSLVALLRQTQPNAESYGLLEAFAAAQPLWRDYVASRRRYESRDFNPYGLSEIEKLRAFRRQMSLRLDALRDRQTNPPAAEFEELARDIPEGYDPLVGCCLFVQPADQRGRLWVMNRLMEGTGRYSCRFTAAMPDDLRLSFVERFTQASTIRAGGQRVELLDIVYGRENTVNQHWPQTPKVLEIPGESTDLPRERRLHLSDLRIRIDPGSGLPTLHDAGGTRYLPCQMNAVADAYMPVLLKFLSMFGPLTSSPEIFPSWAAKLVDGVTVLERLTFGNLVFRRKRWVIPVERFPDRGLEPMVFFREMRRRLELLELPRQVFWIEFIQTRPGERGDSKPQFLDFSSPLLVAAFQASLGDEAEVTFEEVLPERGAFPLGADGERWGIEIVLESLLVGTGEER